MPGVGTVHTDMDLTDGDIITGDITDITDGTDGVTGEDQPVKHQTKLD